MLAPSPNRSPLRQLIRRGYDRVLLLRLLPFSGSTPSVLAPLLGLAPLALGFGYYGFLGIEPAYATWVVLITSSLVCTTVPAGFLFAWYLFERSAPLIEIAVPRDADQKTLHAAIERGYGRIGLQLGVALLIAVGCCMLISVAQALSDHGFRVGAPEYIGIVMVAVVVSGAVHGGWQLGAFLNTFASVSKLVLRTDRPQRTRAVVALRRIIGVATLFLGAQALIFGAAISAMPANILVPVTLTRRYVLVIGIEVAVLLAMAALMLRLLRALRRVNTRVALEHDRLETKLLATLRVTPEGDGATRRELEHALDELRPSWLDSRWRDVIIALITLLPVIWELANIALRMNGIDAYQLLTS